MPRYPLSRTPWDEQLPGGVPISTAIRKAKAGAGAPQPPPTPDLQPLDAADDSNNDSGSNSGNGGGLALSPLAKYRSYRKSPEAAAAESELANRAPEYVPDAPSGWRKVLAAAVGGLGGAANAGGKLYRPIDVGSAQDAILYPGLRQKQAAYNAETARLQGIADSDRQAQEDDWKERQMRVSEGQLSSTEADRLERQRRQRQEDERTFLAGGGEFIPENSQVPVVLPPPGVLPGQIQSSGSGAALPAALSGRARYMPISNTERTQTPSGYVDAPGIKSPAGMRAVQIKPDELYKRNKQADAASKQGELYEVTPAMANSFPQLGLTPGTKISSGMFTSLIQNLPDKKDKNLVFERHTDDVNGNVTVVGRDPATGEQKFSEVLKGVARGRPPASASPGQVGLTDSALEQAAMGYVTSGKMPTLGMGASADRIAILNKSAELFPHINPVIFQSDYKSISGALSTLERQRSQVMAFEDTASRNLNLASSLSSKVDRTGSPFINRVWQAVQSNAWGDPDLQAFHNSIITATNEYAKVITGQTGGAAVSDAARREAQNLLNTTQNPEQFKQAVAVMQQEMQNRREGMDQEVEILRQRVRNVVPSGGYADLNAGQAAGPGRGAGTGAPPPQRVQAPGQAQQQAPGAPATGNYRYTATGPNGQRIGSNDMQVWYDLQTGQPVQ